MEEAVGIRWHHFITKMADRSYPDHRVKLEDEQAKLSIFFRALGTDAGLSIRATAEQPVRTSRTLLQKMAGAGLRFALAWRDSTTLYLPDTLDFYPSKKLNQDLYIWLTGLASCQEAGLINKNNWYLINQQQTLRCLQKLPGLAPVYQRLASFEVKERGLRLQISAKNQTREKAICQAILHPGTVDKLPKGTGEVNPVFLWLYPGRDTTNAVRPNNNDSDQKRSASKSPSKQSKVRRQAEYVEDPDGRSGLLLFRLESLFTWSEFIPLDRTADDSEEDDAEAIAEDLDKISLSQNRSTQASRIRLDLDLPSAIEDDIHLTKGLLYPEWDYRKQQLQKDYCCVIPTLPRDAYPAPIPEKLRATANRLRGLFSNFNTSPLVHRRQLQGQNLDINACIEHKAQQLQGQATSLARVWNQRAIQQRDLACLVLADLSLSTDAWANNEKQVIDIIKESLHLLGEALNASNDDFALYGFSSRKRDHVRYNLIKNFKEPWGEVIHGRIKALKPGYYTRMGAAIRQSVDIIKNNPSEKRLLLILTDGKPNDLDLYEGRYGIEDTRMAILEAHREGIDTYCVTIDQSTSDYVPYVFGQQHFFHLTRVDQLPAILPRLYLNLTGHTL